MRETRTAPTYTLTIYMAGDYDTAKRVIRDECYQEGLCVTLRRESYIYTGGEEEGIAVTFQNYPRFPADEEKIKERAGILANRLLSGLCQKTFLMVTPTDTFWITQEPPGAR